MDPVSNTETKPPVAQVAASKKAAEVKAKNAAKRPQPLWLQPRMPTLKSETPPAPERLSVAHQSQGPPRLLDKRDILAITNVTYPTVWSWMRAGTFPRARMVGEKSMWLSTEVDAWLSALPVRPLKGDKPPEVA
jgi:predicted DNA-binding transcriptional regulator AlpA